MALIAGTRIGAFEITSPLGQGGMGVVFRARDTRLGRHVAIQVLPDEFATDRDRLSRFQREAQVLASLNHPNIAHIYGLEESPDTQCIVMELVEGETLSARLKRGPVPHQEALQIARQIAQALEAAHTKGIVHRDLKPSNVMLLGNGDVKVLDFGLAKVRGPEQDALDQAEAPTMLTASTPGMILGTAAYISPEQVNGKPADAQSDIWSFGCVLYEILTGELAFGGDTITEILGSVLKTEPDWKAFPKTAPFVTFLVRRCLEKDRRRRLHDISDVRITIEEATSATKAEAATAAPRPREMRLEVNTPPTVDRVSLAISPDGQKIVFTANPQGRFVVYRNIDPMTGYDIRVLPVDGDRQPSAVVQTHFEERDAQFSPDGQWIAYQSNESGRFEIYVQPFPGPGDKCQISVEGGTQARWRRDGEELFYIGLDGRLMATSLRLDPDSQYVDVDPPVALFPTRIGGAVQSNYRQQYAVSADGQRFLMNTVTQEAGAPITVILNWKARP